MNAEQMDTNLKSINDKSKKMKLDECLQDASRLISLFMNNEFEKSIADLQSKEDFSIVHSTVMNVIRFLQMMLTMSKDQIEKAIVSVKVTAKVVEKARYSRSYKNYLLNPDYNKFTDEQCLAEICYALTNLNHGFLIALRDQSVLGIINAGYKVNITYRTFNECNLILKNKTNWKNQSIKMHFESFCLLGQGAFEMMISLFPAKLSKTLEYIGFAGNQQHALETLIIAAQNTESLSYSITSLMLIAYYGFCTHIYGLGEKNLPLLNKACNEWLENCPDGAITKIIIASTAMNASDFDSAIKHFDDSIKSQNYWIQLHFISYFFKAFCYAFKCEWLEAAKSMEILRDKCKWSSSLFYYLHAMFYSMHLKEIENKGSKNKEENAQNIEIQKMKNLIKEELRKVPLLKRKLGGIHVFHEEISITRSKKYINNLDSWILPVFEILYAWNFFYLMDNNLDILQNYLKQVNIELKKIENQDNDSIETKYYLIFYKAVLLKHLSNQEEAIKLFEEVLKNEKLLKQQLHLVPQAWYELAMIEKANGDRIKAKEFFKKVYNYSDYFGEGLITYRVENALEIFRKQKKNKC